jgi:MFS family permease
MPQYFQGVLGTSAMGSGLRLLPLIGGFVAGLVPAGWLTRLLGAKVTVAAGFAVFGAGLAVGAATSPSSGNGFAAAWLAVVGVGLGLMFATASSASLSELSEAEAGIASGMVQALKSIGAPLGSAILGSVIAAGYQARLTVGGLPPAAAATARTSLFGALGVARDLKSAALLASARGAFVHGMDAALLVAAGIAAAGLVFTLAFLPGRPRSPRSPRPREGAEAARQPGGSHAITP